MIKLQAIGHLGKDALVNDVNGKKVINFSVAHSEKYKDANGTEVNKSIWVECSWWTDRTAVAQYLKKGTQVFVEGQPEVKQYKTKDGQHGANIGLRVMQVQLLGGGEKQQSQQTTNNYVSQNANEVTEPIDDLPF